MFEYRYSFSVDDDIIGRYSDSSDWMGNSMFETRIKYIVKGNSGERMILDSESYALGSWPKRSFEGYLQLHIGMRLKDCWMPDPQIRTMIRQFMSFAKQIAATGRQGKIPVAVDVEVCTVQREGEAMAAAAERAMRPEYLPPLYLYEVEGIAEPMPIPSGTHNMIDLEGMQAAAIRVEDVEKVLSVMNLCVICGRKPIVGTMISSLLLCGHAFHYHCIAKHLMEEANSCACPICHRLSGYITPCRKYYDLAKSSIPQDEDEDVDEDEDDD